MSKESPIFPSGRTIHETMVGVTQLFQAVFHGLDDDTLNEIKTVGERKTYEPAVILCRQGEVGDRFFVIIEGKIAITQQLEDGQENMIAVIGTGKYFGEMSLLDDTPRTATCTTMTKTTVLELSKEQFQQIIKASPAVAYSLIYRVLNNMRENDARAIDALLTKNEELEAAYAKLQATQEELLQAERAMRDIEIAADVQRDLLPETLPQVPNFEFAAYLGSLRAGGDLYDVVKINDEYMGVLIGDLADSGVQAAILMAVLRTLFLVESQRSLSPMEVMEKVHDGLMHVMTTHDQFLMAFYGVLHIPTGIFSYAMAGHERPYIARPGKGIGQLPGRGSYLGQTQSIFLEERRIRLSNGDRLVLFSDGVVACLNDRGEPFGHQRLQEIIEKHIEASAEALCNIIQQEIWSWQLGSKQDVDFALLIVAAH